MMRKLFIIVPIFSLLSFLTLSGCTFDTSGLSPAASQNCGNGIVDSGEECDATNLGVETCTGLGYNGGSLSCNDNCTFNTDFCMQNSCGNNIVDSNEDCDGVFLSGQNCVSLGFGGGDLKCSSTCTFDTSDCSPSINCGNGNVDNNEECDGNNLNSKTCMTLGYDSGTLSCSNNCTFDLTDCRYNNLCGNGSLEGPEECDGNNLDGESCFGLGFIGGSLNCTGDCHFDTSSCTASLCGNGTLEGPEECDGANLGGNDCTDFGFTTPNGLLCDSNCNFDTALCSNECGNTIVDTTESCDDGNTTPANGTDDFCSDDCSTSTWSCDSGLWPGYISPVNTAEENSNTWATWTNTSLNGSDTGYVTAAAGSSITLSGHYLYDKVASGCSGCVTQFYWGFFAGNPPADSNDPNAGFQACLDNVDAYPNEDYSFSIDVPNTPGTYYLRWGRTWQFHCWDATPASPGSERNLAVICVY